MAEAAGAASEKAATAPELTLRQLEVLEIIDESRSKHGFSPTIREIGDALDIGSTNGVNDHLKALERKRCVTRAEMKTRTLQITAAGRAAMKRAREALGE